MTSPVQQSETVKPCPFCGSEACISFEDHPCSYYAKCTNGNCDAIGGVFSTEEQAIEKWNIRAPDPVLQKRDEVIARLVETLIFYSISDPVYRDQDRGKKANAALAFAREHGAK